jgi:hypothetical protein
MLRHIRTRDLELWLAIGSHSDLRMVKALGARVGGRSVLARSVKPYRVDVVLIMGTRDRWVKLQITY